MSTQNNSTTLVFAIVDKDVGERVLELCRGEGYTRGIILDGRGTANKQILQMLGIERIERDIAICAVEASRAQEMLLLLNEEFGFYTPGNGIAFTISPDNAAFLSAAAGLW